MKIQSNLFGDLLDVTGISLVSDAQGGIVYHPGVVPFNQARQWYAALRPLLPWRSEDRPMYHRIVAVPRLTASVWLNDPSRPGLLDDALAAVQVVAPAPYTRASFNLYRDGQDSVAPHSDRVDDLVAGWPIAILSLGAPRDMLIQPKPAVARAPHRRSQRVRLAPGSVLVMSHASQFSHVHGIPKTGEAAGPRISIAFRVRRAV
jgi:alkylated DNA repair dioxygenase AlkB